MKVLVGLLRIISLIILEVMIGCAMAAGTLASYYYDHDQIVMCMRAIGVFIVVAAVSLLPYYTLDFVADTIERRQRRYLQRS